MSVPDWVKSTVLESTAVTGTWDVGVIQVKPPAPSEEGNWPATAVSAPTTIAVNVWLSTPEAVKSIEGESTTVAAIWPAEGVTHTNPPAPSDWGTCPLVAESAPETTAIISWPVIVKSTLAESVTVAGTWELTNIAGVARPALIASTTGIVASVPVSEFTIPCVGLAV